MHIDLSQLLSHPYLQVLVSLLSPVMKIVLLPIFYLVKRICWEVYLLFTRLPPTQAWMDPREQTLMIKYIEQFKRTQG